MLSPSNVDKRGSRFQSIISECYCCTTQTPVPSSLYSREIIIHTTLNTQGHTITAQRLTAAAPAVTACQFV